MTPTIYAALKPYIGEIILSIGTVVAYLFGKKKRILSDAQDINKVKGGELDNVQGALGIYRAMLDDIKVKLEDLNHAYHALEIKLEFEMEKVKAYESKIKSLDKENRELILLINSCPVECNMKKKIVSHGNKTA
jgi:cell shape-determining protein MreC